MTADMLTIYPRPTNDATRAALTGTGDKITDRVQVSVPLDVLNRREGRDWAEGVDALTGRAIRVRRAPCGLRCLCDADVEVIV